MNQPDPFEHHLEHPKSAPPAPRPERSPLAVHRDPSQSVRVSPTSAAPSSDRPGLAWARIADLPARASNTVARRGVDLFSELVRRGRRAPVTATRNAAQRVSTSHVMHRRSHRPPSAVPPGEALGQ
ncbi:hypothetical protein GCM10007967_30060 [Xylanimonas ulmi]